MGDVISGQEEQEARRKYAQDHQVDPRDAQHKNQPPPASVIFNNASGKVEKYDKDGKIIYDNADLHITNGVDISGFNITATEAMIESFANLERSWAKVARKGFGPGGGGFGPQGPGSHFSGPPQGPGSQRGPGNTIFYPQGGEGSYKSYDPSGTVSSEDPNADFQEYNTDGLGALQSLFNTVLEAGISMPWGSLLEMVGPGGDDQGPDNDGASVVIKSDIETESQSTQLTYDASTYIETEGTKPLSAKGARKLKEVGNTLLNMLQKKIQDDQEAGVEGAEVPPPGFFDRARAKFNDLYSGAYDFYQHTADNETWQKKHDIDNVEHPFVVKEELNTHGAETITKNTNAGPSVPSETGHLRTAQNLRVEPAFQEQGPYAQTGIHYPGGNTSSSAAAALQMRQNVALQQQHQQSTVTPFGTPVQHIAPTIKKEHVNYVSKKQTQHMDSVLRAARARRDVARENRGQEAQRINQQHANQKLIRELNPSRPPKKSEEAGRSAVVVIADDETMSVRTNATGGTRESTRRKKVRMRNELTSLGVQRSQVADQVAMASAAWKKQSKERRLEVKRGFNAVEIK